MKNVFELFFVIFLSLFLATCAILCCEHFTSTTINQKVPELSEINAPSHIKIKMIYQEKLDVKSE